MKEIVTSAFLGFIFTVALFAICFFLVVGVKLVVITVKNKFAKPTVAEKLPAPEKPTKKPRAKFKSIEINPDEIDRIYVRK